MDGRGWPWKRKSSDKVEKPLVGNESTPVCSLSYLASLENQVPFILIPDLCFYIRLSVCANVSVLVRYRNFDFEVFFVF